MAFDWSKVGGAPAPEQIEISVFGPGYGESMVAHLGGGVWIIVDSCIDPTDSESDLPVPLRYLRTIGVEPATSVKLVVATHWHADHVRGIGKVVSACSSANFSCANALLGEEFLTYISQMAKGALATEGAKITDFHEAIRCLYARQSPVRWAGAGKTLLHTSLPGYSDLGACRVIALSPSDLEYELFLQSVGQMLPKAVQPQRAAIARTPNKAAVVLQLEWANDAGLLGSDMETSTDPQRGWKAVVIEAALLGTRRGTVVKIPHHGSYSGHYDPMWTDMLVNSPIGVITPFNRGKYASRPPKDSDIERITGLCNKSYISARRSTGKLPTRDRAVERGLKERGITLRNLKQAPGLVRLRRATTSWTVELFGPACELAQYAA